MSYAKKRVEEMKKEKNYQIITSPERWRSNLLTLRRSIKDRKPLGPQVLFPWELGFLRRDEFMKKWETVLIVYMSNIYTIRGTTHFPSLPQKQYANVEMMLADGWEVD